METVPERVEQMFQAINMQLKTMNDKFDDLITENKQRRQENEKLKQQLTKQENKIALLEREIRRKNIIIKGVQDKEKESREETIDITMKLVHRIGVQITKEIEIDEIKRIGKYRNDRSRPILLKLTTQNKKAEILGKTRALKGTNIWLEEDYTKEIIEERKKLIPHLKEARKEGHKAVLKYNKLIINDTVYEAKKLETQEEEKFTGTDEINKNEKKRTVSERSPQGNASTGQLTKITRTAKN